MQPGTENYEIPIISNRVCHAGREMASKSQVEKMLERDLADLESLPDDTSCMYKVPQILYDANKEAYTPKVISIGPYHCKSKNLYASRSWKKRFLRSFLERTESELGTWVEMAKGWEEKVWGYYGDECDQLDSDELVHMILMDGIFIVEITLQWSGRNPFQGSQGPLYMQESLKDDIMRDITLLENQLPFFVLKGLGDHSFPPGDNNHGWIFYLTTLFIHHFDLIPGFNARSPVMRHQIDSLGSCNNILHLVDFIHTIICLNTSQTFGRRKLQLSRSATELQEAGVKLGSAQGLSFPNIHFTKENGLLKIPCLVVKRNTESLFRNIIAYEQCHRKGNIFRSYVILMDCLINTSQDVDLLVDSGIIENSLGETEDVCTLFNNLYKMPMMNSRKFSYVKLCQDLNKYSRDPWHKWKAAWFRWKLILRRDYFSSPWSIFSVIAAFILLSLTIIQTICSIKGVKW